ncbi:MAG: hypothetical protein JRF30_01095 [Deltaproteobacteria bacterium]|nr:hypothetical protein [Deltaproteobacteria bacterium]MBW1793781.1 hypothetical protein [Deltaproteobacteria bacterium]MBW2329548.1 hypothetical protein [Deltaproteobacteria bacterium]
MRSSESKENTRVLFSPAGYIAKEIVTIIRAANDQIVAAIYLLSSKYVAKALSKAVERGVSVRLALDRDQADKYYSVDEWIIERGIQTQTPFRQDLLASKKLQAQNTECDVFKPSGATLR